MKLDPPRSTINSAPSVSIFSIDMPSSAALGTLCTSEAHHLSSVVTLTECLWVAVLEENAWRAKTPYSAIDPCPCKSSPTNSSVLPSDMFESANGTTTCDVGVSMQEFPKCYVGSIDGTWQIITSLITFFGAMLRVNNHISQEKCLSLPTPLRTKSRLWPASSMPASSMERKERYHTILDRV